MKKRGKYLKIVEWSDEDRCFIGSIPGFLGPCCHGENEQEVYNELCVILDEWTRIHEKDQLPFPEETINKKYSGKFLLRINQDLHKLLSIKALQLNLSLNQLCENLLKKTIINQDTTT